MSNSREVDLVISGGTVVTPSGPRRLGIAVDEGRIVAIARDELMPPARETYDATGKHLIPGLVDSEAHPGCYSPLADDLATESRAAVAAGVTTWGIHAPSTRLGDPDFVEYVQPADVVSFHDPFDHFTSLVESDSAVEEENTVVVGVDGGLDVMVTPGVVGNGISARFGFRRLGSLPHSRFTHSREKHVR